MAGDLASGGGRSGADKRAYVRLPLRLPGEVIVGHAGAPRQGELRDFCRGGVFFAIELDPRSSGSLQGESATLRVRIDESSGTKGYVLNARIARVFPAGIGLAFVDPDPAALRALQHLATASQARETGAAQPKQGASRRSEIVDECKALSSQQLNPLFLSFCENVEQHLLTAARETTHGSEQTKLFDALNSAERQRGRLVARFGELIGQHFDELGEPLGSVERPPELEEIGGLTLVDQDAFEDFLIVSELVARAEPVYEAPLFESCRRLSHLCGVPIDGETNPVGPLAVCHALRSGLTELEIDHAAMPVFYEVFQDAFIARLGGFYDALNKLLDGHGLENTTLPGHEPPVPKAAEKPAPAPVPEPTPSAVDEPAPLLAEDEMIDIPGVAASAPRAPSAGAPASSDPWASGSDAGPFVGGAAAEFAAPRPAVTLDDDFNGEGVGRRSQIGPTGRASSRPAQPGPAGSEDGGASAGGDWLDDFDVPWGAAPGPVQAQNPSPGAGSTYSAPDEAEPDLPAPGSRRRVGPRIAGAAQTLFGLQRRYTPSAPGVAHTSRGEAYSTEHVLSALEDVAASGGVRYAEGEGGLRGQLSRALGGADGDARGMAADVADSIELVENLFRAIEQDDDLDEELKAPIARLELAVQRRAIVQPGFFTDSQHEIRRFINDFATLNLAVAHDAGTALDTATSIIERIVRTHEQDADTFATGLAQLSIHIEAQRDAVDAQIAKVVSASDAQQQFVRERRAPRAGAQDGESSRASTREWELWLERTKRLSVGTEIVQTDAPKTQRQRLVWIGDDHSSFVFVDRAGQKSASMSLPELAMQMRRGNVVAYETPLLPLVERALYAVLHAVHQRIERRATHDETTGLVKRKTFEREIEAVHRRAIQQREDCVLGAFALPALSALAPETEEQTIRAVVDVLVASLPTDAVLSRPAPSELAFVTLGRREADVREAASAALDVARDAFHQQAGDDLPVVAAVGVALLQLSAANEDLGAALDEVRVGANLAARDNAPTPVVLTDEGEQSEVMDWETFIARTLGEDRLQLRFQRIGSLTDADARPLFELLLGLRNDDGEAIPAREFVNAVEYHNQAAALDRWVLRNALQWMVSERRAVRRSGGFLVKLTGSSLCDENLSEYILAQLTQSGVPPGKVVFEIREADAVEHVGPASRLMRALGEFGCRFVLDKFASGQDSHEQMKELPVDFVKIEGRFVSDLLEDQDNLAVVHSVTELARALGIATIAEFVENEEILMELMRLGVDLAQGRHIEAPMYIEELEASAAIVLPDVSTLLSDSEDTDTTIIF
ncbi:MAG: DUF1631 family protein [Gammaproteobacteria bacterium]|nr:DUF1631 family protein [Gammaproteobacteria bacterium]